MTSPTNNRRRFTLLLLVAIAISTNVFSQSRLFVGIHTTPTYFSNFRKYENNTYEFYYGLNRKQFYLANGLSIEYKFDKKIIGIKEAEKVEQELKSYLIKSIIPEAPITVSTETIGSKKVLFVKVWNGSKQPYVVEGNIFIRKKSQSAKATPNDISKLIIERQKTELHWERQPAPGVDLADLDQKLILSIIFVLNNSLSLLLLFVYWLI